jgi:hypothetical protein
MDLRTFIKAALLDIVSGIKDAQAETEPGDIVPDFQMAFPWVELGVTKLQSVEFDILVRAEETLGKEAKVGVVAGFFGAGVHGSSTNDSAHESRIKLRIPIRLPTNGILK